MARRLETIRHPALMEHAELTRPVLERTDGPAPMATNMALTVITVRQPARTIARSDAWPARTDRPVGFPMGFPVGFPLDFPPDFPPGLPPGLSWGTPIASIMSGA